MIAAVEAPHDDSDYAETMAKPSADDDEEMKKAQDQGEKERKK